MVQHNQINHTGLTGVSTVSYASNVNRVDVANYGGAASTVTRGDHVHLGVTSLSHTSNTFSGPVTLVAQGSVGITSPSTGTFAISAVAGAGGGGAGDNPVVWTAATSMPGSPATNQRITRTDLGLDFYYDGTRWLSVQRYDDVLPTTSALEPYSGTISARRMAWPSGTARWVETIYAAFYITGGTALSASHKWVITFTTQPGSNTIGALTIDSGATDAYRFITGAVGAVNVSTDYWLDAGLAKTGTPGDMHCEPRIIYRLIGT